MFRRHRKLLVFIWVWSLAYLIIQWITNFEAVYPIGSVLSLGSRVRILGPKTFRLFRIICVCGNYLKILEHPLFPLGNIVRKPECLKVHHYLHKGVRSPSNPHLAILVGYGQAPFILRADPCPAVDIKSICRWWTNFSLETKMYLCCIVIWNRRNVCKTATITRLLTRRWFVFVFWSYYSFSYSYKGF